MVCELNAIATAKAPFKLYFMFSSVFIGRQREPKNSLYRNIILSKASRLILDSLRFYLLPVKNGDGYKQFARLFHVIYQACFNLYLVKL